MPATPNNFDPAGHFQSACLLALVALIWIAGGCDREKVIAAVPSTAAVSGNGVLTGQVNFVGDAPVLSSLPAAGCPECARLHPNGIPDESVMVNPNGTLSNVIVHVEGAPAFDGASRAPAVLDQVGCRYVPHVVGVQVGQTLRVSSSDPFLHNVHLMAAQNPAENRSFPGPGSQDLTFATAEIFKSRCDVHPWMTGWVGVFADPYFAVTGPDGRFKIDGLPAGKYTLVAWHERLSELREPITIAGDRPVDVTFSYKP